MIRSTNSRPSNDLKELQHNELCEGKLHIIRSRN